MLHVVRVLIFVSVRCRRSDADADPPAHYLGRREHVEDRYRRRHADAAPAVQHSGGATCREIAAGIFARAEWDRVAVRGGAGGNAPGGNLKVVTTNLTGGWLRKNGIPYSDQATVIEYVDRFTAPGNSEWLVVTTAVTDPKYLTQEFVTSTHFRREPDGSKWDPTACRP